MDADQTMRQRALELAKEVCDSIGKFGDVLSVANDFYKYIKSGTMPYMPDTPSEDK